MDREDDAFNRALRDAGMTVTLTETSYLVIETNGRIARITTRQSPEGRARIAVSAIATVGAVPTDHTVAKISVTSQIELCILANEMALTEYFQGSLSVAITPIPEVRYTVIVVPEPETIVPVVRDAIGTLGTLLPAIVAVCDRHFGGREALRRYWRR